MIAFAVSFVLLAIMAEVWPLSNCIFICRSETWLTALFAEIESQVVATMMGTLKIPSEDSDNKRNLART